MKIRHLLLSGSAVIIALSLCLTSCRKHEKQKDNDTSGIDEGALLDRAFEDIGQISNEAASIKSPIQSKDGYLTNNVWIYPDLLNGKIVVDFGTTEHQCMDGLYRKGKIFISFSGIAYWDSAAHVTITTTEPLTGANTYFVGADPKNMNQIIGTRSITNNGHNAAHHMNWTSVNNGKIIKANGQTIVWQSTRNCEWIAGEGTLTWADDVYATTGSSSGTNASSITFTLNITSPLIRKIACPRIYVAGTFDYTPGSKSTRHVDFSPPNNGACDNIATVTINGNTYTIYL